MKILNIFILILSAIMVSCNKGHKPLEVEIAPVVNAITPPSVVPVAGSCPTNFILVPGNTALGTADFCVAKFHTKNFGGLPVVTPGGAPWDNITANDAMAKCENITEAGYAGKFTIISNPEWMTIARNIEQVPENWTSGIVGTGQIAKGHTDGNPDNPLAVSDESDAYNGTLNSLADSAGAGQEQRRILKLSNGNVIWDFSGNIWTWVDWSSSDAVFTTGPLDASETSRELTELAGSITAFDLQPAGGHTSFQSFGQWFGAGGVGGAVIRGGRWGNNALAGPFSMYMANAVSTSSAHNGFRCVYRP